MAPGRSEKLYGQRAKAPGLLELLALAVHALPAGSGAECWEGTTSGWISSPCGVSLLLIFTWNWYG